MYTGWKDDGKIVRELLSPRCLQIIGLELLVEVILGEFDLFYCFFFFFSSVFFFISRDGWVGFVFCECGFSPNYY